MKFCYFGLYKKDFSVNAITQHGLKKIGSSVIECSDSSSGFIKYWKLYCCHKKIATDYDVMIVGFPGHVLVPLARLLTSKPIIVDFLGPLEDADYFSHNKKLIRRIKNRIIDYLAILLSDAVLVESVAQKNNIVKRFGMEKKIHVVYTGALETRFFPVSKTTPSELFTVLFRGSLTPESGIIHILKSALLLRNEKNICFKIIGRGKLLNMVEKNIMENDLYNVEFIKRFLSEEELRKKIGECSLSLGQFEVNPRVGLTIPHKLYESFSMGVPFMTADSEAIREIIQNEKNGFLIPPADPQILADSILNLSKRNDLQKVAEKAKSDFDNKYSGLSRGLKIHHIASGLLL